VTTADFLQFLASRQKLIRDRTRALVEIESPSDNKAAVDHAGNLVATWAKTLDGKVRRHPQKEFGDVLEIRFGVARHRKSASPDRLLILGHLDTVWPMGTLATMPWREAEGRFWGPGVLDMKAGVVMALEAIAALKESGSERPFTLLLNPDEEVGSPVSRRITESLAKECTAVLVLEPAQGLAYKTARKGVGEFRLTVQGVASHAGVDFEAGHSAIREMARLVERISNFTDLPRGITVTVGVIAGGTRSNVVPSLCTAIVDLRIARLADAARMERRFRSLKTTDQGCTLTITGGVNRPPMERKAGTSHLFRQARRLAAQLGLQLNEASTGGGSDGNFAAALGVPTLDGMGAVGAGAHAPHEHVVVKHLTERSALLAGMLASVN
jgi:glutamate carboxypeptidase